MDFRDVFNRHQAFSYILSNAAWLSQPHWQERLDLSQRTEEKDQVNTPEPAGQAGKPRTQNTQAKEAVETGKALTFSQLFFFCTAFGI